MISATRPCQRALWHLWIRAPPAIAAQRCFTRETTGKEETETMSHYDLLLALGGILVR